MNTNLVIVVFTSISFIIYGINSFTSDRMVNEYERWGFKKYRKIIGISQILCGAGLLLGIKFLILLQFASLSLVIMMSLAILVRLKIKDNISEVLPAITYFVLSVLILFNSFN
jgi:uncharacterized membrane protein YphA (DoxX/SURF4 family)|tara:strand:+ start:627 stop:965 length:339 start_codon:yes stop_codon:yes gene_type:complete